MEPPTPGYVWNDREAHRPVVTRLPDCHWGGWAAHPGTGGIKFYQWGIGLRPNGTEILPFQYAPYVREGRAPPLLLPAVGPTTELYCTVRATTAAGVGATASSAPFRICGAVANATVAAPAVSRDRARLCAAWHVPADDPGRTCLARQTWAIGHRPFGASVMHFTEVAGAEACANVSLRDGQRYYVTVQLHSGVGAAAAFASDAVYVDSTAPLVRAVTLGLARTGAVYAAPAAEGDLTAHWRVADPHSPDLAITLEFLVDGVVAATVWPATPEGNHTQTLLLEANATHRCRVRARNRAGLVASGTSNAVRVDGTPPQAPGRVSDGWDPRVDAVWQRKRRQLAATWGRFEDPETPIEREEVCFGTAPMACDVSNFTAAAATRLHVQDLPAPLRPNVTYYATVRAYNGAGLAAAAASDGVALDVTAPAFPPGAAVRLAGGGTATAGHNVSVVWDAARDDASGVARYEVDVGHQRHGASMYSAIPAGPALGVALQLRPGPPEYPFYVTVRAVDRVGLSARLSSARLVLDTSPPRVGPLRFALGHDADYAVPQPPALPSTGFYAFLAHCADEDTGVARVAWALRARPPGAAVNASGEVPDWRGGWRVEAPAAPSGSYTFEVTAWNGVGLRRRRSVALALDSTGPGATPVWDGPGAADVQHLGPGQRVHMSWGHVWDAESHVTRFECSLVEVAPDGNRTVVPWEAAPEPTGCEMRGAALVIGRRYASRLRATNRAGLSTVYTTDGFTVVPTDGGRWVTGLEAPAYSRAPAWPLAWADVLRADPAPDPTVWVAVGTALGVDNVRPWAAVGGGAAQWVYNGSGAGLVDGGVYWAMVQTARGVRAAARTVLDGSPPVARHRRVAVVAPAASEEFLMNATAEVCWRGMFADPHSGVAGYRVDVARGPTVLASYDGLSGQCARVAHGGESGDALTIAVTATNPVGLSTTVTAPLTVDLSPPAPPARFSYGSHASPVHAQTARRSFAAEWDPFGDPESGPTATTVCLGTAPGACDVQERAVGAVSRIAWQALPRFNASAVWPALRACNRAALCTSWHPDEPLRIDTEPPEVNVTLAGPVGCPAPPYPCDTVWLDGAGPVTAHLSIADPGSGLQGCVWGIGGRPGADNVAAFAAVPVAARAAAHRGSVTAPPRALPEGPALYVTVRCWDMAASAATAVLPFAVLSHRPGTEEAVVRLSAGVAPAVRPEVHVTWGGFEVVDPALVQYFVAVGRAPGAADAVPWAPAGNGTAYALTAAALPEGPHWVSVRAQYPSLRAGTSSHRLLVDGSPPLPGTIQRLAVPPPLDPRCLGNVSALDLQWSGFADAVSHIASYEFAVVEDQGSEAAAWQPVGRRTYASVAARRREPGGYRVLVRATDAAGHAAQAALPLVVDGTAPEMGAVRVFGAARRSVVASLTEVRAEWAPARDEECDVVEYATAIGNGPDSITALPYTSQGLRTAARLGNLTLRHGLSYTLTLVALNGAGLSGRAHATFSVDATAPAAGDVYLQSYRADGACQGPGDSPATFVASADNATLCARGFVDPDSATAWALSVALDGAALLPWHSVQEADLRGPGHTVSLAAFNVSFLPGLPYTARLRVTNAAGLVQFGQSAPFYLDDTPPSLAWFLYGTPASQTSCVLRGDDLRAEWAFADAESGPDLCSWAIGSSFGAEDVMPYTPVDNVAGYVIGARAALPAVEGTYFVTLRMTNRAGLVAVHHVAAPLTVLACAEGETCPSDVRCM